MRQQSIATHFQHKKLHSTSDFSFDTPDHIKQPYKTEQKMQREKMELQQAPRLMEIAMKDQIKQDDLLDNGQIFDASTASSTKKREIAPRQITTKGKRRERSTRKRKTGATLVLCEESDTQNVIKKRKIQDISKSRVYEKETQQSFENEAKRRKINPDDQERTKEAGKENVSTANKEEVKVQKVSQEYKKTVNNVLSNLSINTQKILKQVLSKQVDKDTSNNKRIKGGKKVELEHDISFSQLSVESTPPKEKEVKIPELSITTLRIIEDLKKEQPIRATETKINYKDILNQEYSLKYKHSQLLYTTRELVLPVHYKHLLELSKYLDNSLNFLKQCRKGGLFSEIKKSVEQTYGRKFELAHFRMMLSVVPDFYTHKWEQISNHRDPQLFIDFPENEFGYTLVNGTSQINLNQRQQIFRQRLLERTKSQHDQFLAKHKEINPMTNEIDESFDPYKLQMWHCLFDPHKAEQIPQAELKPMPRSLYQRSESVQDFLNKSNIQQNLIKEALEKSIAQPHPEKTTENAKELQRLEALSQKTGLSVQTLIQIKAKEAAIKQSQKILDQSICLEDTSRRIQQFSKLSEMIRSVMTFKKVNTLFMKDLLQSLNDNQRGIFLSQSEMQSIVIEMSKLLPEWLSIKDFPKGKLVKCANSTVSCQQGNNYQPLQQPNFGKGGPNPMGMIDFRTNTYLEMQPMNDRNFNPMMNGGGKGLLDNDMENPNSQPRRKPERGNQDLWLLYLLFKAAAFLCYFFLPIVFPKVLTYIVVLMLCAFDFWLTKNIIGRKLVKLRWWYIVDDAQGGNEQWIFESQDNPTIVFQDKLVFWFALYLHPLAWALFCVLNVITFAVFETVVTFTCALIAFVNLYGFRQCQNDHSKRMREYIYRNSKEYMSGLMNKQKNNMQQPPQMYGQMPQGQMPPGQFPPGQMPMQQPQFNNNYRR